MAAVVEDDAPAPPELLLAWQIEKWGAAAVLGDGPIPIRLLCRITAASNIHAAFMSYKAGSNRLADWARTNPVSAEIVSKVREMRNREAAVTNG